MALRRRHRLILGSVVLFLLAADADAWGTFPSTQPQRPAARSLGTMQRRNVQLSKHHSETCSHHGGVRHWL
jgi:hypothetical protein